MKFQHSIYRKPLTAYSKRHNTGDQTIFSNLNLNYGDSLQVTILNDKQKICEGMMPYVTTFSAVSTGIPLCYLNSLLNVSFALNEGSFSEAYKVYSGPYGVWK